ncbi:hypothetical protein [Bradyrhizobium sp. USDA 336]|uniref:phosphopyruvate hydratase n=1 Tax=Bradyrhizobium sp. USDA 336 TaxID=3156311 RepID=UPI00383466CC
MNIQTVIGRAVLDSNANPAIEVEIRLANGTSTRSIAPRGSTTGQYEALVVEDEAAAGTLAAVLPALNMVEQFVRPALVGLDCTDQTRLDSVICAIDGTPTKSRLGGNVCVATSMAVAKAGAAARNIPLYRHLGGSGEMPLPTAMFNIVDGSKSPGSGISGIEFLVIPIGSTGPAFHLEMGMRARAATKNVLQKYGIPAADGPQGAFDVVAKNCDLPLEIISEAMHLCGFEPRRDYLLGLDLAATDFFNGNEYTYPWAYDGPNSAEHAQAVSSTVLTRVYRSLLARYPIGYIEDGFAETDEASWTAFLQSSEPTLMVVGDDLFASSPERIRHGAMAKLASAVLIKPNQIGTVTETLDAMRVAHQFGLGVLVSQRSGENDDDFITHLAVAGQASHLKAGGLSRMDRVIKYNGLLRIASESQ